MITLNDDYFAVPHPSAVHVYTFGERCEPVKVQTCLSIDDAKKWADSVGRMRSAYSSKKK